MCVLKKPDKYLSGFFIYRYMKNKKKIFVFKFKVHNPLLKCSLPIHYEKWNSGFNGGYYNDFRLSLLFFEINILIKK